MKPEKLIIALDSSDFSENLERAKMMMPFCETFKLGHAAYANRHFEALADYIKSNDHRIFLDLKLWDIPRTMFRTACMLRNFDYLTIKWDALDEDQVITIQECHIEPIAVVHLSTDLDADLGKRQWGEFVERGFNGFKHTIISPEFLPYSHARTDFKKINKIVPGIRLKDQFSDDHAHSLFPHEAFKYGADQIILGSAIFQTKDPVMEASRIWQEANNVS